MTQMQNVIRLRLEHQASVREIAAACGIGRSLANDYVARIRSAGLAWPAAVRLNDEELQGALFPPKTGQRLGFSIAVNPIAAVPASFYRAIFGG